MRKDEYMMLREEMMFNQKRQDSITQFTYTTTVAIWAAALTVNNAWIVYSSLFMILLMTMRISNCRRCIAFLAGYMKVALEPDLDLQWETKSFDYYEINKRTTSEWLLYVGSKFDFPILSIISSLLFWGLRDWKFMIYNSVLLSHITLFIQIFIIVFEMLLYFKYSSVATIKKKLIKNWEIVQKNEKEFSCIK
ncbi:MAG: hypothetical protein E7582_00685 [Ruminococcaceae bacterium]|nr:hypothetical protein [Oscillospiraceae bacterium]